MAVFTIPHIKLSGIAGCVPQQTQDNKDIEILPPNERELFINTVGIRYRKVVPDGVTASDLCYAAAEKLLTDLNWSRDEIKILVFITQTPDYLIPNTSSILQDKLKLPKSCLAFDVNLGCSGYVYGLSIIGGLLQNMPGAKALLLVGDISTRTISMQDKSTAPLFSDAGTATALEYSTMGQIHFNLQTDGKEYDDIIIRDGAFRNPVSLQSFELKTHEGGIKRTDLSMKLDGIKIFNFALREVAPNINTLLSEKAIDKSSIDYFIFHQANKLMLESVRKKLQLEPDKVPYSLYQYGNTSSATIPLTMLVNLRSQLQSQPLKLLLSGFGVGLSWGSAYLETENIICPELIEL
ncbi:MAG TPA: ketoacyl-ACP synthase III [Chitinophagales bacterium]|nr:ketoacyl-ACP synthase III [Chitinophagales bacterium]